MQLREVLGDAARDAPPVEVTALAYDNRLVTPGTLFFCVPGFTRDGHDFAPDAVGRGAAALVVQRPLGLGVPEVARRRRPRRDGARRGRAERRPDRRARRRRHHRHERQDDDGLPRPRACSRRAGSRPACSGPSTRSSAAPSARWCARRRRRSTSSARSPRCATRATAPCVMEVSSHALALHRADAIHWAVAIFTNLTQDHLDFHPTMEDYFLAKRRLFETGPRRRGRQRRRPLRRAGSPTTSPTPSRIGIDSPHAQVRATARRERRERLDASPSATSSCARRCPGRFNVLERPRRRRRGPRARRRRRDDRRRAPGRRARARPVRAGRRGPAVRRARRLRPHARLARERPARRAPADRRALTPGVYRRVRRRRRPRPRPSARSWARSRRPRRRRDRHLRQPAQRGPARRSSPRSSRAPAPGVGGRGRPPRGDRARDRDRRARRRRRDRRQGPRAGPGVRGRAQDPVRRRRRSPGRRSVRDWSPDRVAEAAGARLVAPAAARRRPRRGSSSTRARSAPGDLFVGLTGGNMDGGRFAPQALAAGAWGVLVGPSTPTPPAARRPARCSPPTTRSPRSAPRDRLAPRARRAGRSGSPARPARPRRRTCSPRCSRRTGASSRPPQNLNTEIGLPLDAARRAAPAPRCSCSRWRCAARARSPSSPAIAEPDVGVIVNVGPVHLELLGTIEAIAATKAELIARAASRAGPRVVPADEPLLEPHRRAADVTTVDVRPGRRRRASSRPA